eukprot:TRINITY_DN13_c0_g1_i2.p1 TRINITY_DN13_c0_g1~~TRINITY_DN13_c0_g1_i2.p1  ORF type:complete len:638 (+),score=378.03 TRINITY_DN13_c0_g1_i2:46-1959(+)
MSSSFLRKRETIKHGGDVKLSRFNLEIGGKSLLRNSDLTLSWGHRYGLVGLNGCGKTTLMKALSARDGPFAGADAIPAGMDILLVQQEVPADERSAIDTVIAADAELISLRDELAAIEAREDEKMPDEERDTLDERLGYVHERLEEIGADSADMRASAILSGLQFPEEQKTWATKRFSGGWRMRIALAQALFRQPRLLLLDEPTNHLDLHAVIWLEHYLSTWTNTLVVVSHDRDFLSTVATDIYQIHARSLHHYKGSYVDFEKQFAERLALHQKAYDKQQKKIKQLKKEGKLTVAAISGKGGRETKATRKQKEQLADKGKKGKKGKAADEGPMTAGDEDEELLEKIAVSKIDIKFNAPAHQEKTLISIKNTTFGYSPDKILFKDLDCGISMSDRIAVVGANGTGKSTLLKLLSGDLTPLEGDIEIDRKARIGFYSQHTSEGLDLDMTPVEYLISKYPEVKYQEARNILGRFGLPGELATRKIESLSGGERCRVAIVELALARNDILLLDEPTNHLDLESIDALIEAVNEYEGGVVIVTHSLAFIARTCDREGMGTVWVVGEDHEIFTHDGGIEEYRDEIEEQFASEERVKEEEARERVEKKRLEREEKAKERAERAAAKGKGKGKGAEATEVPAESR